MRRLLAAMLTLLVLWTGTAAAETPALGIAVPGEEIRPGRAVVVTLTAPEDGTCMIRLLDETGAEALTVAEDRPVSAGTSAMYWNGTCGGVPVPAGSWRLVLEMNGRTAETPVTVGRMVPCLISVQLDAEDVEEGDTVLISFYATEKGSLDLLEEGDEEPVHWDNVEAGEGEVSFQAEMAPGVHELSLVLTGEDGTASDPVRLSLNVQERPGPNDPIPDYLREKAENGFTPAHTSLRRGEDLTLNYWTLPMDISDEKAVWRVLTAPITVLDNGKKNAEKTQVILRAGPSEESEGVGMVTCVSQGVHVLERGEEWTLVECYSSSFHDSPILNWNTFVQGYVPTAYLTEVEPNQEMGLVVDKLTQRLYVFREGKLYSTLLISTGVANKKQPYNETRSGEFLLVSKVGEFSSDNLKCALALRFNDGDLLHEVPYIAGSGYKDYSINEPKLGTKASHGCIRVQRQPSPEGVDQKWLWNNYKKNTKILIWEDWQGRQVPVPEDSMKLYCLKKKTGYYHTSEECSQIKGKKLQELTYGELDTGDYRKLKRCLACAAPFRRDTIAETNERYAEGGDHDPVLTEARKNCPRKLKQKRK